MHATTENLGVAGKLGAEAVDVTELSLRELAFSDNTVLDIAVRRRLTELDEPREIVAGWQSAL
jgi:FXSXX-COOH protein